VQNAAGRLPIQLLQHGHPTAARNLLEQAASPSAAPAPGSQPLLRALAYLPHAHTTISMTTPTFTDPATGAVVTSTTSRSGPAPYFADVAARLPQTAEDWQLVPGPDPCLGRALPTVLTRSEAEARCLVARLPRSARLS
jgi:hypothetical protein